MKSLIYLTSVLLSFILLTSMQKGDVNYKVYENKMVGIAVNYPDDWVNRPDYNHVFMFSRTAENQPADEAITLTTDDAKNLSVDNYISTSLPEYQKAENFKFLSKENLTVNENKFIKLIYTFKTGGVVHKIHQCFAVNNNKAYILTYFAHEDSFDNWSHVFEEMIKSFKFI